MTTKQSMQLTILFLHFSYKKQARREVVVDCQQSITRTFEDRTYKATLPINQSRFAAPDLLMKVKNLKEENWGRPKIIQDVSRLNRTLCWFSIFFSFIVSSEKEGLSLGSFSQHSFIILYLLRHKNYAWYVEQQFWSIPIVHFRVILSLCTWSRFEIESSWNS